MQALHVGTTYLAEALLDCALKCWRAAKIKALSLSVACLLALHPHPPSSLTLLSLLLVHPHSFLLTLTLTHPRLHSPSPSHLCSFTLSHPLSLIPTSGPEHQQCVRGQDPVWGAIAGWRTGHQWGGRWGLHPCHRLSLQAGEWGQSFGSMV